LKLFAAWVKACGDRVGRQSTGAGEGGAQKNKMLLGGKGKTRDESGDNPPYQNRVKKRLGS